jgi:predicted transcriptional regulator
MQNAISMNIAQSAANEIITIKDIANECGLCVATVKRALSKSEHRQNMVAEKTKVRVRECAETMGYNPNRAKTIRYGKKSNRVVRSASGNFSTREEETKRMLYLRNEKVMTNPEIAEKVGVSYLTVLRRIGPQPKELTEMSLALAGERKVRRNQARRNVLLKQKIAQFEAFQKEAEAINAQAMELEAQAQKIADEAKAVREQYSSKVVQLDAYRKEAEKAAKELGRNLA